MANTVIGIFDSATEAQDAIELLTEAGIKRSKIDISTMKNNDNSLSSGQNRDMSGGDSATYNDADTDSRGANAARATGEQAGNAIARFFHSLFGDDSDEAKRYSSVGQRAHSIITVHADSGEEAERVADLLDEAGAIDVDERAGTSGDRLSATTGSTSTGYANTGSGNVGSTNGNTDQTGDTINRIEEELQVGKRSVQTGGVRVRSRIIERPVEEHLRLREERVNVERTPVNKTLSTDDYAAFEEKEIELTEYAEVPVVNKEARVVEEIRVGKEATERDETIRDTVRKTEVDVDNIDSTSDRDSDETLRSGRTGSDMEGR